MVYSYTSTYYSSLHDSVLSLCKSILPFKKKRLPSTGRNPEKLQFDNLKWQQDSFHQMLNLMGLQKEGILAEHEVSAFRVYMLETLIAAPFNIEHPAILRDKLLFLKELLSAKCISQDEYHASKRPLLQRLAVQGAEVGARDLIVGRADIVPEGNSDEEWSVIDLKDENWLLKESSSSKCKSNQNSALKQVNGAASVFSYVTPYKPGKKTEDNSICSSAMREVYSSAENPFWNVQLKEKEKEAKSSASESVARIGSTEKATRKPFRTLFLRGGIKHNTAGKMSKSDNKQFKNSKRIDSEDETAPLPLNDRLETEGYLPLRQPDFSPAAKVLDTKHKLQPDRSSSSLVSTYSKEFKEHIGEMDKDSISTQWTTFNDNDVNGQRNMSTQWTTFDEDENFHPNLFASQDNYFGPKQQKSSHLIRTASKNQQTIVPTTCHQTNPFLSAEGDTNEPLAYCQDHNPFWTASHSSSLVG